MNDTLEHVARGILRARLPTLDEATANAVIDEDVDNNTRGVYILD